MSNLSAASFEATSMSTVEVEASERIHGALADDLRAVIDVAIRTDVDADTVAQARDLIQRANELLSQKASEEPAGVKFNDEGRSWNWGNAVVGVRNAIAPPVKLQWSEDGEVTSEVDLGVAYEGPPGCVHGGVSALLLDHLMGETASNRHTRLTVTGTLTLRYVNPLPLGTVRMNARIDREDGRKITVVAQISSAEGQVAIEATGLFIIPRWAYQGEIAADIGSLD